MPHETCPKCRAVNLPGSSFCCDCGNAIAPQHNQIPPRPMRKAPDSEEEPTRVQIVQPPLSLTEKTAAGIGFIAFWAWIIGVGIVGLFLLYAFLRPPSP